MNVGAKLSLYAAGLVAAFFAAFFLAGAIVPESLVQSWIEQSEQRSHDDHGADGSTGDDNGSGAHDDTHGGKR